MVPSVIRLGARHRLLTDGSGVAVPRPPRVSYLTSCLSEQGPAPVWRTNAERAVRRQVFLESSGGAGEEGAHASRPRTSNAPSFPQLRVLLEGRGAAFPCGRATGGRGCGAHRTSSSLPRLLVLGPFFLLLEVPAPPSRASHRLSASLPPGSGHVLHTSVPWGTSHGPEEDISSPCSPLLKCHTRSQAPRSRGLGGLGPSPAYFCSQMATGNKTRASQAPGAERVSESLEKGRAEQ